MTDDLDKILASEEMVTPSPGFLASVMHAVHHSITSTAAIRFPWIKFAAGFLGGLLCLLFGVGMFLPENLLDFRIIGISAWSNYACYASIVLPGILIAVRLSIEFTSE